MSSDPIAVERPLVAAAPPSVRRRVRRTQEQRRLVTRARLISAVVEVIRRKGYAGLRAKHITAASGMTWGAAQHLFGDKNELLLQVATRVSDELVQRFDAGLAEPTAPLRDRVDAVVKLIWSLYSSPDYYAMVEIVRGSRADTRFHNKLVETLARFSARVEQHWLSIFSDVNLPESRSLSLCNIVVLTLSGLAARKIYLRLTPNSEAMLDELVDCVATALDSESTPRKRGHKK